MSEAIWIELIKVLPAFLWIGFGFIALAVAKRIFTAQAPRMTKVETPWITVELAQQAIEQAAVRDPEVGARGVAPQIQPPAEPDWAALYPLPTQQVPPGTGFGDPWAQPPAHIDDEIPFGDPAPRDDANGGATTAPTSPPPAEPEDEDTETFPTGQHPDTKSPNTPPADGPADNTLANGANRDEPPSPMTEPNMQVPNISPTYPIIAAPPGGGNDYRGRPIPPSQATYYTAAPLPPYRQAPAYQPAPSNSRSRRAATRLAFAAKSLDGGSILWVDDHPEHNESLVLLFRSFGMRVETVLSTEAAMQALRSNPYDLVISDMGRYNEPAGARAGLELLDRIEQQRIPTPVVLYTIASKKHGITHSRLSAVTADPEDVVHYVIDFIGNREKHPSQVRTGWLGRLRD